MCRSKFIHNFSSKALALCLFTAAVSSAARADVVLNNTAVPQTGGTVGTTIGSAFITGNIALSLSSIVFFQSYSTGGVYGTDSYVSGETFSVSLRNANGTVGSTVFTNFNTDPNNADGGSTFQTEADVNAPFILQPNTGYYFSVTAPSTTTWSFMTNRSYSSLDGVTFPATGNEAYKVVGGTTTYFSDTSAQPNFQSIYIVASVVPEPSTYCLMAVAGLALVVSRKRTRKLA